MIPEPVDANRDITVTKTFHLQTNDELSDKELKQIKADDQAIQTILLGLPEDIYAAVIQNAVQNPRVQNVRNQNGLIGVQGNGNQNLIGNGHYARNCTVRPRRRDAAYLQTQLLIDQKEEAGIQLQAEEYDLMVAAADLDEIEEVNANCILMTNLQQASILEEQYTELLEPIPESHQIPQNDNDVISEDTSMEQGGKTVEQYPANLEKTRALYESLYQNFAIEVEKVNLVNRKLKETNTDMTTELARYKNQERCFEIIQEKYNKLERCYQQSVYQEQCLSKKINALHLSSGQNAGNPAGYNDVIGNLVIQNAVQNPRVQNVGNQNGLIGVQGNGNQNPIGNGNLVAARAEGNAAGQNGNQIRCYNCRGAGHYARNCTVRPRRRDAAYLQTQLLIDQKEEAGIQLQAEEYDLMVAAADLDETEEVNANCILMANLQQASILGTQTDSAPVYDTDGSAENDNDVISEDTSVEQGGETAEQYPINFEETRALYESLYHNLAIEVEKVNLVNRKLKETNADMTTELVTYKNQERCFEISQEKYNKLERCYQQSVYQEQCLSKKINALHLSSGKQIMILNEQISELNKQLSKEKSTVSFLLEEKKNVKSDFKTREDKLLDKQIHLERRIKELNKIVLKTGQSIQTIHMLSPKPNSFYHTEQKMALGYQNPLNLKQTQKKQQSLYDGKVLLEKHDPPVVHDSEETLQLAQKSRDKMKQMNKEIKPANYTKINHLSGVVSQDIMIIVQNESVVDTSDLQTELERNLKLLINFIWKFMGTVRFGNDHVAVILGFGDLQNACFIRNLQGVDLLKGDHSTNLYTINLHEMAYASPICLMARASSTKSWLWHQRLSHLNFDTINDLARNDLVAEVARTMLIFSHAPLFLWAEAIPTACFTQNRSIIHRRFNKTPYELINDRKPDILFLHVFGALCYPKNDREDIGKLGAKGDIGFFIGYSANSCAYKVYNRQTKKIMETMNVSFDELSAMAFKQCSSKPGLNSELDLLFETMYDDYIGGQPSATARTIPPTQEPQVRQTSTTSTTIADTAPIPTNSSSLATNIPISSQDVDELNPNAMMMAIHLSIRLQTHPQAKPTEKHLKEVKGFFRYLRETINMGLWYMKDSGFELTGFSDADYVGCKDTFKSTSGGAQFLGEKLVSWSSKKQDCTALSTVEAEYVSLSACCAQVLWMQTQLTDYGFHFNKILIYYDSKSAIAISCNP
nr:hypothetical protein [Tanacetum cinerariifolium]